jgi:hypothetical protein
MEAGRSGKGGQLSKKGKRKDAAAAPPVFGDEDFPFAEKQLVVDTGGFLMEAARVAARGLACR